MNSNEKSEVSKKEKKIVIKNQIYISLVEVLNQITQRLIRYSEINRILSHDDWARLIDSTFKRLLRNAHKEIRNQNISDTYWNKYMGCLQNLEKFMKEKSREALNNQLNSKEIIDINGFITFLWGGKPEFILEENEGKHRFLYKVYDFFDDKILNFGTIILSLRRRNESSKADIQFIETISNKITESNNVVLKASRIIYLTPYNTKIFKFNFDKPKRKKERIERLEQIPKKLEKEQIKVDESNLSGIEQTQDTKDKHEWVGIIRQTSSKPMRQGIRTRKVEDIEVEGWIYESHCHLAQHDRYFIAQHPELSTKNMNNIPKGHRRRLLLKINDFKDWSENVAHEISDDPRLGHFTQCWFNFEKFLDPDKHGSYKAVPIAGTGIDRYKIRELDPEEYYQIFNLWDGGIPLGLLIHDNDVTIEGYPPTLIPFYFPVSEPAYEQIFYTPTFFVGRPGSGKTNSLKTLTAASLSCADYASGEEPGFIFFDYEGQFSSLKLAQEGEIGDEEDKRIWNLLNINPVKGDNVKILSKTGSQPIAFSFKELFKDLDIREKIKCLKYFLRNISEATENIFDNIAEKVFSNFKIESFYQFRDAFYDELENPSIPTSESMTTQQKKLLIRTIYGDIEKFFDQEGESFQLSELINSGKILIFDLKGLDKEKTILYVLLVLQKLKIELNRIKCPVIVVIDEAHEVFKNISSSSREGRYYGLISKFLAEFGSRGRKYRLGIWLASQRPQDLHKDIDKVVETYFIFGLNPEHKQWLTKAIGTSKNSSFILDLPGKFALFKNAALFKGDTYLLKLVKSPNIHRTFL